FVRAVKGIIDIVTFIVTQGAQIIDFVNAVLDAVIQIANGGQAGVPKLVEAALAASVPLLIGFLAALLGIGGLANKVKSVFQSVSRPVTRAIDKIVDFIAKKGKSLWSKLKGKKDRDGKNDRNGKKGKDAREADGKNQPRYEGPSWWLTRKGLRAKSGESHTLLFRGSGRNALLVIRSNEAVYRQYLETFNDSGLSEERKKAKASAISETEDLEGVQAASISNARKKEKVELSLARISQFTIKLIGEGESLPDSTPPIYGNLSPGGFGSKMTINILTRNPPPVGSGGSEPKESSLDAEPYWKYLSLRREKKTSVKRFYVLGHLLNHNVHGPGDTWENLAPQSTSGNGKFRWNPEDKVKGLVLGNTGKGVRYTVSPVYDRNSSNKASIVKKWAEDNDPDLQTKTNIIDAEDHVPTAYSWEYKVVFEDGKFTENGEGDSGQAPNEIRQEAEKYHL
ncbi:DNA/RNA non-specific endonuclease, partial [Streptomyces niveus]